MTNNSAFDRLEAANPFAAVDAAPQMTKSADALYEEIVMQTLEPQRKTNQPSGDDRPRRRPLLAGALLAVGCLAVFAMLTFGPGQERTPALAEVSSAAESLAAFDSGRVQLSISTIQGDENEDSDLTDFDIDHRFSGDDSATEIAALQPDDEDLVPIVVREVDGQVSSSALLPEGEFPLDDFDVTGGLFLEMVESIKNSRGNSLELLEQADDYVRVSSDSQGTRYRSTLDLADVMQTSPDDLPPGLSILAGGPDTVLTGTVEVNAWVEAGLLTKLEMAVRTVEDGEPVDFASTLTFSEMGERQSIEAAGSAPVVSESALRDLDRAGEIFSDFANHNPDVCPDQATAFFDDQESEEAIKNYVACLEAEGETVVAEALTTMTTGIPVGNG